MNGLKSQAQISHRRLSRRPSPPGSVAILVAASLFATVVTGCGSKPTTGTSQTSTAPLPQAAQIVQDCATTTAALHSVHVALAVHNVAKLPVDSVNADVTNQPLGNGQAVGDAKVRLQPGAALVTAQFLVTNKTMYTKTADGHYTPVGPAGRIYDPGIILDKDKGLANVIRHVQNPKVDGRETINGVASVKVSGTIDASVINPVVPRLGQGASTLPVTLWIVDVPPSASPTTSPPSGAPSPGTGANLVRMVVNKDQGSVEITLSAWGKPVQIPNPAG